MNRRLDSNHNADLLRLCREAKRIRCKRVPTFARPARTSKAACQKLCIVSHAYPSRALVSHLRVPSCSFWANCEEHWKRIKNENTLVRHLKHTHTIGLIEASIWVSTCADLPASVRCLGSDASTEISRPIGERIGRTMRLHGGWRQWEVSTAAGYQPSVALEEANRVTYSHRRPKRSLPKVVLSFSLKNALRTELTGNPYTSGSGSVWRKVMTDQMKCGRFAFVETTTTWQSSEGDGDRTGDRISRTCSDHSRRSLGADWRWWDVRSSSGRWNPLRGHWARRAEGTQLICVIRSIKNAKNKREDNCTLAVVVTSEASKRSESARWKADA